MGFWGFGVLGFWVGGPGPGSVVEKSGPYGPLDSSTTIFKINVGVGFWGFGVLGFWVGSRGKAEGEQMTTEGKTNESYRKA